MTLSLYFAADLSHVILSTPDPPPASLWWKPAGVGAKLVAVYLLTPANLGRLLWQTEALERRYALRDYPLERIIEVRDRLRPILDYALDLFGRAECEAALDALQQTGGPKRPLPQPAPIVHPSPFDADYGRSTHRWNPNLGRWEKI